MMTPKFMMSMWKLSTLLALFCPLFAKTGEKMLKLILIS